MNLFTQQIEWRDIPDTWKSRYEQCGSRFYAQVQTRQYADAHIHW